jgi:hypothetical protein
MLPSSHPKITHLQVNPRVTPATDLPPENCETPVLNQGDENTRHMHSVFTENDIIRATVTLDTPFYGAAKATSLLNTGRGAPIPLAARRPLKTALRRAADEGLRRLVSTLPGVHDLLPVYNGLAEGETSRRLTPADIEALGGDRDLAAQTIAWQASMEQVRLNQHCAVVGVEQPTAQSLRGARSPNLRLG